MRGKKIRGNLCQVRAILLATAGTIALPVGQNAMAIVPDFWIATGGGNWSDGAKWSSGSQPGATDVYITNAFSGAQTITYDYTGIPVNLNSFTLGSISGGTDTFVMTANNLAVSGTGNENIGIVQDIANFNQSGGTQSVNGGLFVGDGGTGNYTLSGGNVSAFYESIGDFGGSGNFNQSSGANAAGSGGLSIASSPSSTSTYTLSLGNLTSAQDETVGRSGLGSFIQMGGTNTLGAVGNVYIGLKAGASGTYTLTSGALVVGGATVVAGTADAAGGVGSLTVGASAHFTSSSLIVWKRGLVKLSGFDTTLNALQIDPSGGLVDVTDGSFTIDYSANPSPNAVISNYISNAYNVSGTPWSGTTGITSTLADTHHSVAFADGSDGVVIGLPAGKSTAIPAGGTLPAGNELITYTFAGDANIDGKVDFADFVILSNHFGGTFTNWDQGNFNYDSGVDFADFVILSNNFGLGVTDNGTGATAAQLAQYNALAASFGISASQIAAWDKSISALPEPAS
ncbi:MAG: hypothetical protein M3O30_10380, partial [Planctomycetota bacterium]|nr:hypothetical protein [Planctomycetota bacterium]